MRGRTFGTSPYLSKRWLISIMGPRDGHPVTFIIYHFQAYLVLVAAMSTCAATPIGYMMSRSKPIGDYLTVTVGQTLGLECSIQDDDLADQYTIIFGKIITPYEYHFSEDWRNRVARSGTQVRCIRSKELKTAHFLFACGHCFPFWGMSSVVWRYVHHKSRQR